MPRSPRNCPHDLGQWKEAAAAFEKNIPDEKDWADCWYMESLARLAVGDGEGYRSMWAFRDRASKRLSADGTDWTRLGSPLFAWSCALAPGALDDPARVVEIAGRALDAHPGDAPCLAASGAALYRAGRFEEAASRLDRAIAVEGDADSAASWRLFLAMAQHRLGRHDAARASLAKAIEQIEREGKKNDTDTQAREPSWTTRVEQRLLLREAEASVGDKARFDGGPLPDP